MQGADVLRRRIINRVHTCKEDAKPQQVPLAGYAWCWTKCWSGAIVREKGPVTSSRSREAHHSLMRFISTCTIRSPRRTHVDYVLVA